jgi:hypothetical protein
MLGTGLADRAILGGTRFGLAANNMLSASSAFDNGAWGKTSVTVAPDVVTAPDGSLTADRVIPSAVSAQQFITGTSAPGFTAATVYTLSVYAKTDGSYPYLRLSLPGASFTARQGVFHLGDGVVSAADGGVTASIQGLGGGWHRCAISAPATSTAGGGVGLAVNGGAGPGLVNMAGDGVGGIVLWRAQLVPGGG